MFDKIWTSILVNYFLCFQRKSKKSFWLMHPESSFYVNQWGSISEHRLLVGLKILNYKTKSSVYDDNTVLTVVFQQQI